MSETWNLGGRALLAWVCLAVAGASPAESQSETWGELAVGVPYRLEGHVLVDFTLTGIFDDEIRAALESGLPATLIFGWELWRQRSAWWDRLVDAGETHYRVYFDLLDERFDVFDDSGRRVATCRDAQEVEQVISQKRAVALVTASRLRRRHRYYVAVTARMEPLDLAEVRDLEGWLRGGRRRDGQDNLLGRLSYHARGLLTNFVGLGERSVGARSAVFRGWDGQD